MENPRAKPGPPLPVGALVQIVDPTDDSDRGPLLPSRVLINGTDIGLIAENGIKIDVGDNDSVATCTLTLLPRRIEIIGATIPHGEMSA